MRYNRFITMLLFMLAATTTQADTHAPASHPTTMTAPESSAIHPLTKAVIIEELGWVPSHENRCGGYYLDAPFHYPQTLLDDGRIQITSDELLFSQRGTSVGQGKVTITRFGQQIIANKAYMYRDPQTGKLSDIDLMQKVVLREPNSMVVAQQGHLDLKTKAESLNDILYRTAIYNNTVTKRPTYTNPALQKTRKISQLSAWGQASEFRQDQPKIIKLSDASYSTCPPTSVAWQLKAKHIELNKNTGRGTANHARLLVRGVPVLYTPYFNFPIDSRRQTGFLPPTFGSKSGGYVRTPYYVNLAPNYDTTITPAVLTQRGVQMADQFRYLTPVNEGNFNVAILPNDREFKAFQQTSEGHYGASTDENIQAELNRLEKASDTRKSLSWRDTAHYNPHWSSDVDFNYVSDDYYLRDDLMNNWNEVTQNQLLQQAQTTYKGKHWDFLGRMQGYQTMHLVDETVIQNQYRRLPQLALSGDYPNAAHGLDFFTYNELTHFTITQTPGDNTVNPDGTRLHIQPGIGMPLNLPWFYFNPRLQVALTQYELTGISDAFPANPHRALPIFDIHSGLYFDRNTSLFGTPYRQTLEPQAYYTYVPYKNQDNIPVFDTITNTLNYDQLFIYNRFSGLDRIADANQISVGVTTRFINQTSGFEKIRAGVGQILYFRDRRVTLCADNDPTCTQDTPSNPENRYNKSPLSGILNYNINPSWGITGNSIWNPITNHFDNQSIALHYQPGTSQIVNLGYNFVRNGDLLPGQLPDHTASGNLSQTDFSFAWPLGRDWTTVGRWTENWNRHYFQNMLYGLQYDSCCWAVRFVGGRVFSNLSPNNTPEYNKQFFIQFAMKGLGNIGPGDPSQLLSSSISGYQTNFGQDY